MDTGTIRKMIDAAVEEEKRSGQLAGIVREAAKQQGTQPTPEQVLATVASSIGLFTPCSIALSVGITRC